MAFPDSDIGSEPYARFRSWMRPSADDTVADAALRAGAALTLLDQVMLESPPWRGAWLDRLGLQAASATTALLRRPETVEQIRDAYHLCRPGDDPGPAGRIYGLWRRLTISRPSLARDHLEHAADRCGIAWTDELEAARTAAAAIVDGHPLTAAFDVIAAHQVTRIDTVPMLIWIADTLLARRAGWPLGIPLLASVASPLLGVDAGGEHRRRALIAYTRAAVAALGSARSIAKQASILQGAAGKLRAKGAPAVVSTLLSQDAVGPGLLVKGLSDRGLRRLYDRLTTLGAVRELTGRESFRLYGL